MANEDPYYVIPPEGKLLPIVLSSPHSGTKFPPGIQNQFDPAIIERPPDTDWFIHKLYDFAPSMGITMIHAKFSRYVIDLNRDPSGERLYVDNRRETRLVPIETFDGRPLYPEELPSDEAIEERHKSYYLPYYEKLDSLLNGLREEFQHVLLFDAHSIKHLVPSIRPKPFNDLILGNQEGKTAHPSLSETALSVLKQSPYSCSYNDPFMGGRLTRHFGNPERGIHALQLEMCQRIYMNEETNEYDSERAEKVRETLKNLLQSLAEKVRQIS